MKSNWVMLLVDERCLQPGLLGTDRIVPVASVAARRDLDASSSTQRAATKIAAATNFHQHRPPGICRVVSAGTWRAGRFEDRQAGDRGPLASCRLPSDWRWKSRPRSGRPKTSLEIRQLIREMSLANPLWGAPRLHGELLKLGIDVGQTTVGKYMARGRRPPSQGWKTFLHHRADGLAQLDLFVVPTISFRLLYGLLIMGHGRRQILWFGVTANPTAEWIANQVTEACGWEQAPRYLIRDADGAYGEIFIRRLRSMGLRDRPTSPRSPWQNGYAERPIGSIRRECLDHVVVFSERHLRHLLLSYMKYYNGARRIYPWRRMPRSRAPSIAPGT